MLVHLNLRCKYPGRLNTKYYFTNRPRNLHPLNSDVEIVNLRWGSSANFHKPMDRVMRRK